MKYVYLYFYVNMLITFLCRGWILCGTQSSSMDTIAELRNLHKIWVKHGGLQFCQVNNEFKKGWPQDTPSLESFGIHSPLEQPVFLWVFAANPVPVNESGLSTPYVTNCPQPSGRCRQLLQPELTTKHGCSSKWWSPDSEAAEYADYAAKIKRSALWGSSHSVTAS